MRWRTSVGCLCFPPRASGGVASECRRTNVELRQGHHPHATTREETIQRKGCTNSRRALAKHGRLAGAGTGCGDGAEPIWRTSQDDSFRAAKAIPVWPCHLPNSLGSMHETPIDAVVMSDSGAPLDMRSAASPRAARLGIQTRQITDNMQQGLQHQAS